MLSPRLALPALVAGALVGASTSLAAPAAAADTVSTTVTASPSESVVDFGDVISVAIDVDSESGSVPTEGTSTLYARRVTSTEWRAVATSSSPSLDLFDVKPRMNTAYKVVYSGWRSSDSEDDSYAPSESAVFEVEVARTITRPSGGFTVEGRVRPDYAERKVVVKVSRKQYSGYTRYRAITTDERGRYRLTLPRRTGTWFWSFRVKGDLKYLPASFRWRTWVS